MTKPNYTPGPWVAGSHRRGEIETWVEIKTAYDDHDEHGDNIGPELICTVGGLPAIPLDGGAEWEATGNLIAAAPEMYELLDTIYLKLDMMLPISDSHECARDEMMSDIKALLRKARGGE